MKFTQLSSQALLVRLPPTIDNRVRYSTELSMFSTNRYQMYFVLRFSVSSRGETVKTGVAGGPDTRRGRLRCLLVSGEQSRPGTSELTSPRRQECAACGRADADFLCNKSAETSSRAESPFSRLARWYLPRHKPYNKYILRYITY